MLLVETLEIDKDRLIKVWWAFLWRFALAALASVISAVLIGAIIGGILGILIHLSGNEVSEYLVMLEYIGHVIGIIVYISFTVVPIYLILNKKFGDFSLILIRSDAVNFHGNETGQLEAENSENVNV